MNNNLTEVVVILDRSGSMGPLWSDTTGALDTFVQDQQKVPGECKYTLVVFDTQSIDIVHTAEDIRNVGAFPLHIKPRAGTPLLDALGRTLNSFIERYEQTPESDRPGGVIFVIITDGEENASTKFTKTDVTDTIKDKTENLDWKFIYLSSDINAFKDARTYGFDSHNTINLSATGQAFGKGMGQSVSDYTMQYRISSLEVKRSLNLSSFVDTEDEDLKMTVHRPKDAE